MLAISATFENSSTHPVVLLSWLDECLHNKAGSTSYLVQLVSSYKQKLKHPLSQLDRVNSTWSRLNEPCHCNLYNWTSSSGQLDEPAS